ncbi:Cys-tRNA(Pro)/Cys-tRNA(Cys) deacylase [Carnobacterium alterfunditum]|uniref:Cys-tRNA(Pro)/Cys-tRNA(Cys) deacylase n=1 Tax=Carnobacterium alterfunditum TaxID=28230 RepID=A0A1N6HR65_9LACT|nr:Cys-tRNA(Pro) deacylase [Carnobacterium alterfunditum]SIO22220.1 Cys-tRNA(Pro)/Cys-tRNA(Cys) deacylase [Carnobacterium alterfunditum]
MKKNKMQKTNAIRQLESNAISYQTYEFPWSDDHLGAEAVFEQLKVPKERIYKTLVINGDKSGVIVACIPGASELDLKALAKVSGNKKVELLPLTDLEKTTGYIRGGCSPIGMKKKFPTFISIQAETMDKVIVSAGKRGMQIELDPLELKKLTKAEFVSIEAE